MFTRPSRFIIFILIFYSCSSSIQKEPKNSIVVYPTYCAGCIVSNFNLIKSNLNLRNLQLVFDTTNNFILETAKSNNLRYVHLSNDSILIKYGQYANILYVDEQSKKHEIGTNETILKYFVK